MAPLLRLVVLHHTGIAEAHFDLMVETASGGALVTWRSPRWPMTGETSLTRLPDHRREYLDYEGVVSGGRGKVRRVFAAEVYVTRTSEPCGDVVWTIKTERPEARPMLIIREISDGSCVGICRKTVA